MLAFYPGIESNDIVIERDDKHVGHIMWPKEPGAEDPKEPMVILTPSFSFLTMDELEQVLKAYRIRYWIMSQRERKPKRVE
jgi:hypothetical protein